MTNNKQSSIEWLIGQLEEKGDARETPSIRNIQFNLDVSEYLDLKKQAKVVEQEQAQLYATFVLKCVQNNLPPITFNDWINLENNEQQ